PSTHRTGKVPSDQRPFGAPVKKEPEPLRRDGEMPRGGGMRRGKRQGLLEWTRSRPLKPRRCAVGRPTSGQDRWEGNAFGQCRTARGQDRKTGLGTADGKGEILAITPGQRRNRRRRERRAMETPPFGAAIEDAGR